MIHYDQPAVLYTVWIKQPAPHYLAVVAAAEVISKSS